MKKAIVTALLTITIIVSISMTTFASDGTATLNDRKTVPFTQENLNKYEKVNTAGVTRTASYDYVPEKGYSQIKTDYAKYYFDDNTIKNISREVWAYNKPVVRYGWSF